MTAWDDPVVNAGMRRMLKRRAEVLGGGEGTIGWKLGFGAPVWLEKFGLPGPLLGFLPRSGARPSGATVSCRGWVSPVAEPEIALYIGRDVDDPDRVAAAVSGIGPAIELADVDPPPQDLEAVLAGNIYHRAVILGGPDPGRAGGSIDGLEAIIIRNGATVVTTTALETLTGELAAILTHTARMLEAFGERLRAGEVVIMGSVVPPLPVEPGDEIGFHLNPLPPISVRV